MGLCSAGQLRVDRPVGVVVEVQSEVEGTTGKRLAVNIEVLLLDLSALGACNGCGECSVGLRLVSGTVRCKNLSWSPVSRKLMFARAKP